LGFFFMAFLLWWLEPHGLSGRRRGRNLLPLERHQLLAARAIETANDTRPGHDLLPKHAQDEVGREGRDSNEHQRFHQRENKARRRAKKDGRGGGGTNFSRRLLTSKASYDFE
jgi:hypothetical protein